MTLLFFLPINHVIFLYLIKYVLPSHTSFKLSISQCSCTYPYIISTCEYVRLHILVIMNMILKSRGPSSWTLWPPLAPIYQPPKMHDSSYYFIKQSLIPVNKLLPTFQPLFLVTTLYCTWLKCILIMLLYTTFTYL